MKLTSQSKAGLLFASPWLIGFTVFLLYPLLRSLYNSFTEYTILTPAVWIGAENYRELMRDEIFWKSLWNTFYYAIFAVPLSTIVAIGLAMLLNAKVRGQAFYRTFFFLPALVPAVPMAILWLWLFNGEKGIVSYGIQALDNLLPFIELPRPNWLGDKDFTKNVLILMSTWTVGNAMVIYLAGLQQVPVALYEAADLDGATPWRKTIRITLPMLSPVIMFNVIMSIIASFQIFTQPYIMFTGGAPDRHSYFYTMYIYDAAFRDNNMGYASAMGWIMFLIIFVLTYLARTYMDKRVHYEGT